MFVIAAFYHFFDFPHYTQERVKLLEILKKNEIKGSILIASEGVNGTISGTREAIDATLAYIAGQLVKAPFEHKESIADTQPFGRAKVRLKKELISLGPYVAPTRTGTYIEPHEWNALIDDPDTILLDTRNAYETHLGTFEGAVDPHTKNFKELPAYVEEHLKNAKHKKIATFCTGGIRCEKFTAWMLDQGFENVYHLKGGILKYLEDVPKNQSRWQGECYVFDERVAVGHGLVASSTASMCGPCGHALTPEDRSDARYVENLSCPFCAK